jgi:hypothetical protein
MPNIPCKVSITCGSPDEADPPIVNFSAEAADNVRFSSMGYPHDYPNNPLWPTTDPRWPGPAPLWAAVGCVSVCYSSVSLADAQQCARNQALRCVNGKVDPGRTLYFNQTAQCGFTCPDGTVYYWTVLAGYFEATSQAVANQLAVNYACQLAALNRICLGALADRLCYNAPYSDSFQVLGGTTPITFSLVSGSFPPGLSPFSGADQRTLQLSGTPSQAGDFTFTIRATDANGNFMSKAFTLHVLGISNANSLPNAMEGRAYSQQLNGTGGTGPFTYTVISGSLGSGLTVSSSGLISGTPDYLSAGGHSALIRVRDADGNSCSQNVTLTTDVAPGPNWDAFVWNFAGTRFGSFVGAGRVCTAQVSGQDGSHPGGYVQNGGASGVTYTGPDVNVRLRVIVNFGGTPGIGYAYCSAVAKAAIVKTGYGSALLNGIHDFDFTTGVGAGEAWTVNDGFPGNSFVTTFDGITDAASITWQIFNL